MSALLLIGWLLAVTAAVLLLVQRRSAHRRAERVTRACHELRGPLTNLMLALDAATPAGHDRAWLLPALTTELARARRAAEDLSAASRPVGRHDERRPVDVGALVRDLVTVHDLAARARGRRVVVAASGTTRGVVIGDRARLAQAIGNLIQNAVEHGRGTVRVGVGVRDGRVQVHVSDEGRGLDVPLDRLLAEPRRGQRGRGLRIVADALRVHDGSLRSAPGGGASRLVAELPAARVPRRTGVAGERPLARSRRRPRVATELSAGRAPRGLGAR